MTANVNIQIGMAWYSMV